MITFLLFLLDNFITNIANMFIKILVLSLGEKQYEEGPLAGKKLPKPVQLLGFLLTGATVVSVILIFHISHFDCQERSIGLFLTVYLIIS